MWSIWISIVQYLEPQPSQSLGEGHPLRVLLEQTSLCTRRRRGAGTPWSWHCCSADLSIWGSIRSSWERGSSQKSQCPPGRPGRGHWWYCSDTWIPMSIGGENHVGWWSKIHGFRWWNPSIMIARSLFIDWWNPFFLFDPHQLIINPHLWLAQSAFLDSYSKSPCFLLIHGRPRTSWVANPHLSLVHCLFYDCQVPIFSLVTSSFTVGKSQYRWSKYQFYFLQSAFLGGCVLILYVLRKT